MRLRHTFIFIGVLTFSLNAKVENNAAPSNAAPKSSPEADFKSQNYKKVIETLGPDVARLKRPSLLMLGISYSRNQQSLACIKTLNTLVSQNPKDFEARTLIAAEYLKMNKDTEALAQLKEALADNPKYEPAYMETAKLYEKKKNLYELRILYQDMVEKLGEKAIYIAKLCEISTQEGLYELSEKYCARGIQMNPKEPKNYISMGLTLKERGQDDAAKRYLRQAAESFPQSTEAQMTFGQYLEKDKNFVEAFKYYQRATIADAKNLAALTSFGLAAIEIQKYAESLEAFRKACKLDRGSILKMRQAASVLRTYGVSKWLTQFENSIENCDK